MHGQRHRPRHSGGHRGAQALRETVKGPDLDAEQVELGGEALRHQALGQSEQPGEVQRVLDAMAERNETIWRIVADTPSAFSASRSAAPR